MLGKGTPTNMTALHNSSAKSKPSDTLPLQTQNNIAPFFVLALFLKFWII